MKLAMLLMPHEERLLFDWDAGTYRMAFSTHYSGRFWMSEIADLISEEFLEWAPDR